jgi:hypothetical protein
MIQSTDSAVVSKQQVGWGRGTLVVGVFCLLTGIAVILVGSGALSAGSTAIWLPAALILAGVAGLAAPRRR